MRVDAHCSPDRYTLGLKYLDVEILQCDETHVASWASACYDQGLTEVMNISHI